MAHKPTTVKLPLKKETKRMLQYQADDGDKRNCPIPTLYVSKDAVEGMPAFLEITVKGMDE